MFFSSVLYLFDISVLLQNKDSSSHVLFSLCDKSFISSCLNFHLLFCVSSIGHIKILQINFLTSLSYWLIPIVPHPITVDVHFHHCAVFLNCRLQSFNSSTFEVSSFLKGCVACNTLKDCFNTSQNPLHLTGKKKVFFMLRQCYKTIYADCCYGWQR